MTAEDLIQTEVMLNRFRRLVTELKRGAIARNGFEPWEVELLLDIQTCDVDPRQRLEILQHYQRAVEKQMDKGPGPPMKLSHYLQLRATRRPAI